MISAQDIEEFLNGSDPEEHIVALEYDFLSNDIYKIKEVPNKGKQISRDTFIAFCWVGNLNSLNFYNKSKALQKEAMTKHGIMITKLRTDDHPRLENGMKFLVQSLKGYRNLTAFFKEGGLDPKGEIGRTKIIMLPPVDQYLISKGKRLFKGFDSYDDITRLVFDLETTALEPTDGRIFMIGIKTNKGYSKIIECINPEDEANGIVEFFKIIDEIKPTIISGYNSSTFDWEWIFKRCEILKIHAPTVCKSLNPTKSFTRRDSMLKLGGDVENYKQTSIWGYNVIDVIHSVRRAQAINSDIKSAGLKYITKYINAEDEDRVYIEHTKIGKMYQDKEEYFLNVNNGKYKLASDYPDLDIRFPKVYKRIAGDKLVEAYLDDDLEETMRVDSEFSQASFLLAKMVPLPFERIYTMGTAGLWKVLMLAWSYNNQLAIPQSEGKRNFVGGLSRLVKVGYSKNIIKLDFSSLYPSIQLAHDVFPSCDITGVLKGMLKFFRNARIDYKNLAEEWKDKDKKISATYDNKQLPIKIFINSLFGSLSAPLVFPWAEMDKGEEITCTGRLYLRHMIKFFMDRGYVPLVCDTDGVNFSAPDDFENREYIGKGNNWKVKEGKIYKGIYADVAEYNDLYMKKEMALDLDGHWASCVNFARKNYAIMKNDGKIKLTGNSIKSKKLPQYIERFIDVGVKLLLEGKGKEFIEEYYNYFEKIYNKEIPLIEIANKARVRQNVQDYVKRSKTLNKAGSTTSKMAHMELIIKEKLHVNLGDIIYYVNNGTKQSHGDVSKTKDGIKLNCYYIDQNVFEKTPDLTGEYNVPRAVVTFNKRITPLLVAFSPEIRDRILIKDPADRQFFTTEECTLINGIPYEEKNQDDLNDVMIISEDEVKFWEKIDVNPNLIYDNV